MSSLLLVKIVATVGTVLGLSAIAERGGPMLAGILAGLPLGIAIIFFFVGLQEGPAFVAGAAPYALGGLAATLCSNLAFWRLSSLATRYQAAAAITGSLGGFLLSAVVISQLDLEVWSGTVLVLACAAVSVVALRWVRVTGIPARVRATWTVLAARAAFAVFVVLAVTEAADLIGPRWSGLLAGFPITLFPVLVIVHVQYSAQDAYSIVKGFPYGMPSLVIFVVCAHTLFVPFGVPLGFALSLAASLVWQAIYFAYRRRTAARRQSM